MKKAAHVVSLFLISIHITAINANAQVTSAGKLPAPVAFMASTPCSPGTKPLPGIPKEAACELIKWELKLFGDIKKQRSGTYTLNCVYGMPNQGTQGFINGGTPLHRKGKWIITKGTRTNPDAIVYRLDPDKPSISVSFLRLNENLLHLLDSRQQLMIGNGAWSYTLSRIQQ